MTQERAVELAKRIVTEYRCREVMVIVQPEDPADWRVTADFADGGGNLMEASERLEQLAAAERDPDAGTQAAFDGGRFLMVR